MVRAGDKGREKEGRERGYLREIWARGHGGLTGGEESGRRRGGRRWGEARWRAGHLSSSAARPAANSGEKG